ncbi:Aldo/keto reductase [Coniochaeta ligniaria NRRL 30616]|uniref:Aldo/keto reductase n=1 Tax=Coniochaeta ligniaria NRRL 30616 TaxID=1408157 RepID=A0A1J7JUD6_9PEZI|nr:Aldo/keto reductase [Coniochaeta ligniaria NRRL 30616]
MSTFTLNPPPQTFLARHRQLAPTAAVRVSPLCFMTWLFGSKSLPNKSDAFVILDSFYSKGGNFIEAGSAWGQGRSEEWLGDWMATHKNRDDIVLATKYTSSWNLHDKHRLQSNYGGNNVKSMKVAFESTLSRLQTTYIDLYYVAWWDHTTSIPELMHGLNDLVTAGKVLYLGISDTPAWVVAKANEYARQKGLRQFSVYHGQWHAGLRDIERDILPMCRDEGMAICACHVLNRGRFQTRKEREETSNYRGYLGPSMKHDTVLSEALQRIAKLKAVTLQQVALAYILGKAPYVFPAIDARTVEDIDSVVAGIGITLSEDEVNEIESSYQFDFGFPHTSLSGTFYSTSEGSRGVDHPEENSRLNKLGRFDWVGKPKAIGRKEE